MPYLDLNELTQNDHLIQKQTETLSGLAHEEQNSQQTITLVESIKNNMQALFIPFLQEQQIRELLLTNATASGPSPAQHLSLKVNQKELILTDTRIGPKKWVYDFATAALSFNNQKVALSNLSEVTERIETVFQLIQTNKIKGFSNGGYVQCPV